MRRCTNCRCLKPATMEFFGRKKSQSRGIRRRSCSNLKSNCRDCEKTQGAAWYQRNKKSLSAKAKEAYAKDPTVKKANAASYRQENLEMVRAKARQFAQNNPQKIHARKLKTHYGMSAEEYEQLFVAQEGRCALCNKRPSCRRLHVDHDHKTGKTRQLLCMSCNLGLGHFKDDPQVLQRAVEYLLRHSPEMEVCCA